MSARLMIDFKDERAMLDWFESLVDLGAFDVEGRSRGDLGVRQPDALDLHPGDGEHKRRDYIVKRRGDGGRFLTVRTRVETVVEVSDA